MKCLIMLIGTLLPMAIWAQNMPFTLTEVRPSGKTFDIGEDKPGIVDIGSVIRITVKREWIENQMFIMQGVSSSDARLGKLKELNQLLRVQTRVMALLKDRFQYTPDGNGGPVNASLQDYKDLAELEDSVYVLLENNYEDLYNDLFTEEVESMADEFLQEGRHPYIAFVMNYIEGKADSIRQSFLSELGLDLNKDSSKLVFFRLGAFIRNSRGGRPIHVEHFDDIGKQDFPAEMNFFGKPVSPVEQRELEETAAYQNSLETGFKATVDEYKRVLKGQFHELFPSQKAYSNWLAVYKGAQDTLQRYKPAAIPALDLLNSYNPPVYRLNTIYTLASSVLNPLLNDFAAGVFNNASLDRSLSRLEDAIDSSLATFSTLPGPDRFEKEKKGLSLAGNFTQATSRLDSVSFQQRTYVNAAEQDLKGLRKILLDLRDLFRVFRKPYLANEEFGEEVTRFTVGNIPEKGFIELRYVDGRKPGDQILIKATLEFGNNRYAQGFESRELHRRYLTMERVAPHIRMSGSLILASPLKRENTRVSPDLNNFQFAPSYGIFLKWGNRNSHLYNRFLNFGVGLGFSSPDFSLDGTPEFGAGVMITAFNDILSGGIGWNFGVDVPYSFVGFNLPFTVGGVSNNQLANSALVEE